MHSKAIQRWMAKGGKAKCYSKGGMVEPLVGPGSLGYYQEPEEEEYEGSESAPKNKSGSFGNNEEDYEGSMKKNKDGGMSMPSFFSFSKGGVVPNRASDQDGEWNEEDDKQNYPKYGRGITISFASALRKRK